MKLLWFTVVFCPTLILQWVKVLMFTLFLRNLFRLYPLSLLQPSVQWLGIHWWLYQVYCWSLGNSETIWWQIFFINSIIYLSAHRFKIAFIENTARYFAWNWACISKQDGVILSSWSILSSRLCILWLDYLCEEVKVNSGAWEVLLKWQMKVMNSVQKNRICKGFEAKWTFCRQGAWIRMADVDMERQVN